MYRHNQPRPSAQQQDGWGGAAYGGRQQEEVRVLSSSGYGVRGAQQQQGGGGMYRSRQQQPSMMSSAQPRSMPGHYQGNVVMAGGQHGGGRTGSVGSAGGGTSRQVQGGGRSLSLSEQYVRQGYSQQYRQPYQATPAPQYQQFIPAQQAAQLNQVQRQGTSATSFHHTSSQLGYSQAQPSQRYPQGPPTVLPPQIPLSHTTTASKAAPPENPFLSAFERSFESFLNSKYTDDVEDASVTGPDPKPDLNSVESISSILNDCSKSSSSILQSKPLNMYKSPSLNTTNNRSNVSRQQTILKNNVQSQPKPKYNPIQEARTPTLPKSMTMVSKPLTPAPHKPMQFIPKPTTFVQSKPVQSNYAPQSNQSRSLYTPPRNSPSMQFISKPMTFVQSKPVQSTNYLQPNQMSAQSRSYSMPQRSSPSRQSTVIGSSFQSPQGSVHTSSTNISLTKVPSTVETVVIDEPEESEVAEIKPLAVKTEPGRRFQCDLCPKLFKSNSHLREHESTHTGNYPFKCDTCKKGFLRENKLNNHKCLVNVKEEKYKPFKCQDCFKGYSSKKTLLEHKCTFTAEGNSVKKIEVAEEEEFFGEIVESVEVNVPVTVKSSDIFFSEIYGKAMIYGDLIEYEDLDCNLEEAVLEGWLVEVIGDDNIILDENILHVVDGNTIPDGIEEMAKAAGVAAEEVRDTLEFFCEGMDDISSDEPVKFPWQNIQSVYEEREKSKTQDKSKEKLLHGDDVSNSNTLEELDIIVGKDVLEPKSAHVLKPMSLNKFTYFNDTQETTIDGGSGDDSDDEWTLGTNKCRVCKKVCSSKWHLKQHAQTHTDKDKKGTYKCVPCKKSFKRKDLREKHRCDILLSETLSKSHNSTMNEDFETSCDENTLDEKASTPVQSQSLLLHSTLH